MAKHKFECEHYPELLTYTADGRQVKFRGGAFETDDPELAEAARLVPEAHELAIDGAEDPALVEISKVIEAPDFELEPVELEPVVEPAGPASDEDVEPAEPVGAEDHTDVELGELTVPELREIAAAAGIEVPARATKAELIAALEPAANEADAGSPAGE